MIMFLICLSMFLSGANIIAFFIIDSLINLILGITSLTFGLFLITEYRR